MSARKVPFFDRTRGDAAVEGALTEAFLRVVRSGHYILGEEVAAFERACAAFVGAPHAIGVSSGTDALIVALLALGVGPGDEVICPAYTFFATASAVLRVGATPVLADVDPATYAIDPAGVAARIGPRTRAVMPVHLFGDTAEVERITAAAGGVPVVEDAAQAMGAAMRGGQRAGSVGALGCFSFFPTKNLGGFGDGGLVTTRDAALADRARALRAHGAREKHRHTMIGGNFRLDALQAALLGVELPRVGERIAARVRHARLYGRLLAEAGLAGERMVLPREVEGATFNQYVVRVRGAGVRDGLRQFLAENGVGTEVYYPRPLHLQPSLGHLGYREGDFPQAEAAARETVALPVFPELGEDEIGYVVEQVARFFNR